MAKYLTPILLVLLTLASMAHAGGATSEKPEKPPPRAEDGVRYATREAARIMEREALSDNLLRNGSFEAGRWWPYGWQATDGLTTFWAQGGTRGKRCLRIVTNVLDAQWKQRQREVRAAVAEAQKGVRGDVQSIEEDPRPEPPERLPTKPPYYDTVAGLHGVHYRSAHLTVRPGAVYRFSIDARSEAIEGSGEPKVFIKGFFDRKVRTADGVRTVRRNAYRAPMTLDPCDGTWRRYARLFRPWESKSTMDEKPLKPEYLQVQIYAYWRPGDYFFDNARLEIVELREPDRPQETSEERREAEPQEPVPTDDGYPVFQR